MPANSTRGLPASLIQFELNPDTDCLRPTLFGIARAPKSNQSGRPRLLSMAAPDDSHRMTRTWPTYRQSSSDRATAESLAQAASQRKCLHSSDKPLAKRCHRHVQGFLLRPTLRNHQSIKTPTLPISDRASSATLSLSTPLITS